MIKKLNESDSLKFKTISAEEKAKRGILGRLYGPVASCVNPTRNARKYSDELWEKIFSSDLIKERFANGGLFGELNHPDYEEVDMSKVAIVMPEPPVKDRNGQLIAYVDIIDTPCGKIAYQLAKYGYKFGISSRGTGDLIEHMDGSSDVNPDTYMLNAFDLVEIPAVESARLSFTESLKTKTRYNKTLSQALNEELAKASEADRKLMTEAIDSFDSDLINELEWETSENGIRFIRDDGINWIWYYTETKEDAVELFKELNGAEPYEDTLVGPISRANPGKYDDFWGFRVHRDDLTEDLDQGLDANYSQTASMIAAGVEEDTDEESVKEYLQKIVDYCYAVAADQEIELECNSECCADKDDEADEVVNDESYDELVEQVQQALVKNRKLAKDNLSLQEKLSVCNAKETRLEEDLRRKTDAVINLSERAKRVRRLNQEIDSLNEALAAKDNLLKTSKSRLKQFRDTNSDLRESLENERKIQEKLQSQVDRLKDRLDETVSKAKASDEMIAKYQRAYNSLRERYIQTKAESIGIDKNAIKANLSESYSIKDIDRICENLSDQKRAMSKLPFRVDSSTVITASQSKDYSIKMNSRSASNDDDFVSESLLRMVE